MYFSAMVMRVLALSRLRLAFRVHGYERCRGAQDRDMDKVSGTIITSRTSATRAFGEAHFP